MPPPSLRKSRLLQHWRWDCRQAHCPQDAVRARATHLSRQVAPTRAHTERAGLTPAPLGLRAAPLASHAASSYGTQRQRQAGRRRNTSTSSALQLVAAVAPACAHMPRQAAPGRLSMNLPNTSPTTRAVLRFAKQPLVPRHFVRYAGPRCRPRRGPITTVSPAMSIVTDTSRHRARREQSCFSLAFVKSRQVMVWKIYTVLGGGSHGVRFGFAKSSKTPWMATMKTISYWNIKL